MPSSTHVSCWHLPSWAEQEVGCRQHALRYEKEFLEDMDALGNLRPQVGLKLLVAG